MDAKYRQLLLQTADVIQIMIVTRVSRARARAVIATFIKANPRLSYREVALAVGLHVVTVNKIALEAGLKRGRGRRGER
jgi:hypothetical protein